MNRGQASPVTGARLVAGQQNSRKRLKSFDLELVLFNGMIVGPVVYNLPADGNKNGITISG
jgi:hypothetical protein